MSIDMMKELGAGIGTTGRKYDKRELGAKPNSFFGTQAGNCDSSQMDFLLFQESGECLIHISYVVPQPVDQEGADGFA